MTLNVRRPSADHRDLVFSGISRLSPRLDWRKIWTGCAAAVLVCGVSFAPAVADDAPAGLSGLLPTELPKGIREVPLDQLPEEMSPWANGLSESLSRLYTSEAVSLETQQEVLAGLETQLNSLYAALSEPANRPYFDLLVDLEGKLVRRTDLMKAFLATLEQKTERPDAVREEIGKLIQALEGYEADVSKGDSDSVVRQQMQILAGMTDISALQHAIQIHYYNFNFRTFVSEPFAAYAFDECRRERGPVCDCILGARVSGTQHTSSGVSIDFIPSDSEAKFAINIQGNTRSNTRGVTSQATVYTYGNHYFSGKKVIHLNGDEFSFDRASLGVRPNNTVTNAHLNRRGLLAKLIGDKIAYDKAVDLTPKTENIAAGRLRSRVLPKFNSEVESTFGDLNVEKQKLRERMAAEQIAPNETLARTDANEMRTAERLMNPGQLAADRPSKVFNTSTGITVQLHESWINNSLSRETLGTENREKTFPDFGRLLSAKFERAFKLEIDRTDLDEEDGDQVIIYDVDPLHVQFDNSKVTIILRIGLRQEDKDEIIDLRRVEIPLQIVLEEDKIRLVYSDEDASRVNVEPLFPVTRRIREIAANGIMGGKVREKIIERLSKMDIDRHLIYRAEENGEKEIPVTIAELHAVNGWLIAVIEPTTKNLRDSLKSTSPEVVEPTSEGTASETPATVNE